MKFSFMDLLHELSKTFLAFLSLALFEEVETEVPLRIRPDVIAIGLRKEFEGFLPEASRNAVLEAKTWMRLNVSAAMKQGLSYAYTVLGFLVRKGAEESLTVYIVSLDGSDDIRVLKEDPKVVLVRPDKNSAFALLRPYVLDLEPKGFEYAIEIAKRLFDAADKIEDPREKKRRKRRLREALRVLADLSFAVSNLLREAYERDPRLPERLSEIQKYAEFIRGMTSLISEATKEMPVRGFALASEAGLSREDVLKGIEEGKIILASAEDVIPLYESRLLTKEDILRLIEKGLFVPLKKDLERLIEAGVFSKEDAKRALEAVKRLLGLRSFLPFSASKSMFIRTITLFYDSPEGIERFVEEVNPERLRKIFEDSGIEVKNVRLSVRPPRDERELEAYLKAFERLDNIDYFGGLGTFGVNDLSFSIAEALKQDERLTGFISVESLEDAYKAADVVLQLTDHIASARLLVGVNPPRFSPYLPYSFIKDPSIRYGFSIAINWIEDLHREALDKGYKRPEELKQAIFELLPRIVYPIYEIAKELRPMFLGIDISLAPMPGVREESIGKLIADLAFEYYGERNAHGFMAYIKAMNEALKEYPLLVPLVGYNRVMTPLAEDRYLAKLASEGLIGLDTLKARSAVCSTGVDVVPVRPEAVRGTIVDVIAIGIVGNKTLGARLIPRSKGSSVDLGAIGEAPVLQ